MFATNRPVRARRLPRKTSVPEASSTEITEIIVTAQKRSERLQDVPVPVTAIRGEDLAAQNLLRLQDYYSSIPGLSFTTGGITGGGFSYAPNLSIRGVGGIGGNPTVGILVDDLPYGPTAGLAFGNDVPDFDPADLARVEVLRGPQGTLYGASSIGGLVKFVTIDPTTDYFSASGRIRHQCRLQRRRTRLQLSRLRQHPAE